MTPRFGIDDHGWLYKLNLADGTPPLHIRPLPQAKTQPRIRPWMWINHTQAASNQGSFDAAWNWWTSTASGGGEAHVVTNMDGAITQYMPFTVAADCSYKANRFYVDGVLCGALSDEAQDEGWGPGKPGTRCAYTPAQLETKAHTIAATHIAYGIPIDVVPAGPFDRGVGWHRLHKEWSKYVGKACPGDARVEQQPELRARALEIVHTDSHPIVIPPPADGTYPPGSKDVMYPIDYGIAGTDSWWTEMAITPKGLQWSGGPAPESQKIREIFVAVPMPRAPRLQNDADVVTLMAAIGTFGDCPSTFLQNATLRDAWAANRNPGR